MRLWSFRYAAFGVGAATILAGCAGSQAPGAMPQTPAIASDRTANISTLRGWMSPDGKKTKRLLYASQVSSSTQSVVNVFSVPKYSLVGQITTGIDWPLGLTVDAKGNLYVANSNSNTVTVYPPGETSPSLTLNLPDESLPTDVAVGSNGYVYVADYYGVDVFPPGVTSPSTLLTDSDLSDGATGVAVTTSGDVYADGQGFDSYTPAVVEFRNAKGSGRNLALTGLVSGIAGVISDDHYLIVSDFGGTGVLIYPPGQKSPSSTITASNPDRSAIDRAEHKIYVPEASNNRVGVYDYPSGTLVTYIPIGAFAGGAALSPAPNH